MRTKRSSACLSAFHRTPLVAALACAFIAPSAMAQAFDPAQLVVTNTYTDMSPGSLPYAINYANSYCDTVTNPTITFAIPATGPFVIAPSFVLPQFYCESSVAFSPAIDGSSQAGYTANSAPGGFDSQLMIVVDGNVNYGGGCAVSNGSNGYGGTLTLKGLDIRNWNYGSQYGVCGKVNLLGNRITNNYQGVDAYDGSTIGGPGVFDRNVVAGSPSGTGILFDGTTAIVNNFIGTTDGSTASPVSTGIGWCFCTQPMGTISNNVIVSDYTGIDLYSDGSMLISGNFIGTDSNGTGLLGNPGGYGISLYYSYGATIRDNVIAGQDTAIDNYNSGNVYIYNNRIGTNSSGNVALGNTTGIYESYTYGTRIEANQVSGNTDTGIYLYSASDPVVVGNLIGTDGSGTVALANYWGIYVGGGPVNNTITNNTVSGNSIGIYLADLSSSALVSNRLGTGASGAGSIPNDFGIWAECGSGLTFDGNVVQNNRYVGMQLWAIQDSVIRGNSVQNNGGGGIEASYTNCFGGGLLKAPKASKASIAKILLGGNNESDRNQFTGNVIAANAGKGLFIEGGSNNIIFQNQVSTNLADGVRINSHFDSYGALLAAGTGNQIVENLIFGNGAKSINLDFDGGPLPNDPFDGDTAKPNNWQNRPMISTVTRDTLANQTTIAYSLDSLAGDYRVDFFSNPSPVGPSGQTYIGNKVITLATPGNMTDSFTVAGVGFDNISAVATGVSTLDSSEFADVVAASTLPVPGVSVLPTSIDFGDVVVGRSSASSNVTISSTGTGPYTISALRDASCAGPAICSTGSFACSTSCTERTPYAPGASCTITAAFAPTTVGSQTQTLALCDDAVGSPRAITFTGNGITAPTVDIAMAPPFWGFGEVLVGLQSDPKAFTVTNAGATQVYLGPVTVSDGFAIITNTCGSTLAGGASCSTDIVFVPTSNGGVNGTVQVTGSNTPSAPAALRPGSKVTGPSTTLALSRVSGSGVQHGDLRLPASISFGALVLHAAPAQQQLLLANTGNGSLALGTPSVTGAFTLTNGCGPTLAVGASCTLTLGFNPSNLGTFNGTLTILSDAPGGSRAIALGADVIADAKPVVRVNTNLIGFGQRTIGSESPSQRVIVTNEGAQTANLLGFSFTQPDDENKKEFSLAGTSCGLTLAPQASCFADVVFKPLGFGPRNGEMAVPSNSADSPRKVTLGGTGCRPFAAAGNRSGRDPCAP